jgi:hypothetical protein
LNPEDMTDVQRHNMTCPYCGVVAEHGTALDEHLRRKHGILDREVLIQIYRHQLSTAPNRREADPAPLPPLPEFAA